MKYCFRWFLLGSLSLACACGKEILPEDGGEAAVAPTAISVKPETIEIKRSGGSFTLEVTSPTRPKVASKPEWVNVPDGTYDSRTYQITYTVEVKAFNDIGSREGEIVLSAGSLSAAVKVQQQGREAPAALDIDRELVTADATAQVKALYEYLLSQYGKAAISAVMADVDWNASIAQKVYQNTGKYPAINCFDFIHIPASGSWINYSDITPVKEWHDAGGIVSLMWHFNVPVSEGSNEMSFYSSNNAFSVSRALEAGTWENQWYMEYLDQVADVILQLQEAGIAAIWRPYHEAAGNYYALTWKGSAWFWWGMEGPEAYKRLWDHMFDYFASKGIRNLIWVWTAQGTNQDANSYGSDEPFYPGDDKVVIVARDVYGSTAAKTAADFTDIQATYPHKMVVLGECGRNSTNDFPAFSDIWLQGGTWGWFMPWCEDHYTMVDTDWWKNAFAQDIVLTRDQLPKF